MIATGWIEPFTSKEANVNGVINEAYVLIAYYHLACTTAFVTDVDAREYIGWSMIFFTSLNMGVSMVQVVYLNFKQL